MSRLFIVGRKAYERHCVDRILGIDLSLFIREACGMDLEACIDILTPEDGAYWLPEDFEKSIEDGDVIFLIVEENGEVVGYVQGFILPTKRTEALIHETRVRTQERSKGIGTKLVDAFCNEAFIRGADVVLAEISPDLLGFYRDSCGFSQRGEWIEVARQKG